MRRGKIRASDISNGTTGDMPRSQRAGSLPRGCQGGGKGGGGANDPLGEKEKKEERSKHQLGVEEKRDRWPVGKKRRERKSLQTQGKMETRSSNERPFVSENAPEPSGE